MYISKIEINNFRNFRSKEIEFNDGVNVIIGHNNAGKSNLLKALSLVLDVHSVKRLEIDDFSKSITLDELKGEPSVVSITLKFTQSKNEDLTSDDLVTVGNWLTKLEEPYEASLTYKYYLPEKEKDKYTKSMELISDIDLAWKTIKHEFLRLYTYKIWGGELINQNIADSESLQKFDFQFLDAIRDVERDMLTGKNALLRNVLDFFMDYEIKSDINKSDEEKASEIKNRKQDFSNNADILIGSLQRRMDDGKGHILKYASDTGAAFNKAKPNFEGTISDVEMFSALKLIVEYETGIKIPATHNGLGYNNLIFMSLLLSKMQVNSDGNYLGSNAKVFPLLVIEEPEAHLHPSMQYQFLKFLVKNKKENKVRQIFVTTHSTNITSSVTLDEMICLHNSGDDINVAYPGKVFQTNPISKKYVQRFLDATKSDMLFAQKIILVEGIAEQLLIPVFAKHLGISFEEKHIAVLNVGGRSFDHFLCLFDSLNKNTLNKKVACITDRDPSRKKTQSTSYKKCYPFEMHCEPTEYEYKYNNSLEKYMDKKHPNIASFTQDKIYGKTLEYDLVLENPTLDILVTESIANSAEIIKLMDFYKKKNPLDDYIAKLRDSEENKKIREGIENSKWADDDRCRAIIAARYLNSVGKGENALDLAYTLEENLMKKGTAEYKEFNVPKYIAEALEWVCL